MAKPLPSIPLVLALGISIVALNNPSPAAAGIYRCTNAAGEVGYSDEPCPAGFASDALDIQSRPARSASGRTAHDPYSPIEQVKQLERERERERQAQLRRERDEISGRGPRRTDIEHRTRNEVVDTESAREAQRGAEQAQRGAEQAQRRAERAQREAQRRAEQARREAQLRSQEAKKQAEAGDQRVNAKSRHTGKPQTRAPAPARSW